jgi:hypothetical protein
MEYNPRVHTPMAVFAICCSMISADQMLSWGMPNSNYLGVLIVMLAFAVGVMAFYQHVRHV